MINPLSKIPRPTSLTVLALIALGCAQVQFSITLVPFFKVLMEAGQFVAVLFHPSLAAITQ